MSDDDQAAVGDDVVERSLVASPAPGAAMSLDALPTELLLDMFELLSFRDLMTVAVVCKRFRLVSQADELWLRKAHSMALSLPSGSASLGAAFLHSKRRCIQCGQLFTMAQNFGSNVCRRHPGTLVPKAAFCACGFACVGFSEKMWSCCRMYQTCARIGCVPAPHNASAPASPKVIEIGFIVPGES